MRAKMRDKFSASGQKLDSEREICYSYLNHTENTIMKYIFVTGGVVSSLGKGLAAASIGTLLEHCGLEVTMQKFDPYLNIDPGT